MARIDRAAYQAMTAAEREEYRLVRNVYGAMMFRCYSERCLQFADYGGRGIAVCPEWRGNHLAFIADMGPRPAGYQLDRIDNDADYAPGNCRWVSRTQNMRNRRCSWPALSDDEVRAIRTDPRRHCVLARDTGLPYDLVYSVRKGTIYGEIKGAGDETGPAPWLKNSGNAKLTAAEAEAIYLHPRPVAATAHDFGVSRTTVRNIRKGVTWKSLGLIERYGARTGRRGR